MTDLGTSLIVAVVAWVLGALSMRWLSAGQTRRSELRNRVYQIEGRMRALEAKATEYWLIRHGVDKATNLETEIKGLKKSVGVELTTLRRNGAKVNRSCDIKLVAVNRAITSVPFESRPHQPEQARVGQIQDTINEFIEELRQSLSIV